MAGRSGNWGNEGTSWDERNWDAVQRQEQKKQDVLVMASQNSESIRRMVRQVDETRNVAGETLVTLDQQSGESPGLFNVPMILHAANAARCTCELLLTCLTRIDDVCRPTQAHARGDRQGRGAP
jgi:hypothetical protein